MIHLVNDEDGYSCLIFFLPYLTPP